MGQSHCNPPPHPGIPWRLMRSLSLLLSFPNVRSQESHLTAIHIEFTYFYRVGFWLVPPIVPPNDFACGN